MIGLFVQQQVAVSGFSWRRSSSVSPRSSLVAFASPLPPGSMPLFLPLFLLFFSLVRMRRNFECRTSPRTTEELSPSARAERPGTP